MHRITIGFLIHRLDNDYSRELIKGAVLAARELDVNLVILPGRSLNPQLKDDINTVYEYQHNSIYSFTSPGSFDAAVISAATIGQFVTKAEFEKFLSRFEGVPLITTENKIEGIPCVRMSGGGLRLIASHLIKQHDCKRIGYISGPRNNPDAIDRLDAYKQALSEHNIPFDESLVRYGDFSEYSDDCVNDLLDAHPDLQAICFANDMMCKGGYRAIEKHGRIIGKDIFVTGYDDSEVAMTLSPTLTTVKADTARVGKIALREAVRLANSRMLETADRAADVILESKPVFRESCGCHPVPNAFGRIFDECRTTEEAAERMLFETISDYENIRKDPQLQNTRLMLEKLIDDIREGHLPDIDAMKESSSLIINDAALRLYPPEDLLDLTALLRTAFHHDPKLDALFMHIYEIYSERIVSFYYTRTEDLQNTYFLISNLTKDMMLESADTERSYRAILNNLYRIHLYSSYIFTYDSAIINKKTDIFTAPEYINLQGYHTGSSLHTFTRTEGRLRSDSIFANRFISDERHTFVAAPLFLKDEQYGVIMCEMEMEYFPSIYALLPQISLAIKFTSVLSGLETSLDEAHSINRMLDNISMHDELTGALNRRGFAMETRKLVNDPANEGLPAVYVYADINDLKKINDTFGHSEGDYAIKSLAHILRRSFRADDPIGRLGGDEFSAVALCTGQSNAHSFDEEIKQRIKHAADEFNENSDKPYKVTVSVGVSRFVCHAGISLNDAIEAADAALYEDKKNKDRRIIKAEDGWEHV